MKLGFSIEILNRLSPIVYKTDVPLWVFIIFTYMVLLYATAARGFDCLRLDCENVTFNGDVMEVQILIEKNNQEGEVKTEYIAQTDQPCDPLQATKSLF